MTSFHADPLPPPPQADTGRHGFPAEGTDGEKLAWAVPFAILAPSSHNSQPWLFRVVRNTLELRADRMRALPVVDPYDRELVTSCGCALFTLRAALRKAGVEPVVEVVPDLRDPDLLARVTLAGEREPDMREKWLFWAIRTRRTNRRRYEEKPVPDELVGTLEAAAAAEGARLAVLRSEDERRRLASLVAEADRLQIADASFRRELASWLHPNRSAAADGMPGSAVGIPNVANHVGPLVVRTFDAGRGRAARDQQLALGSPLLVVLVTERDGQAAWMAAGQALAHVLLRATAEDVVGSFLNQPVEVPDLRPMVAELAGGGVPQLVLRLGYAKQVAPTRRRPVEDVLTPAGAPT